MANLTEQKLAEMEAEMNRFEEEIMGPGPMGMGPMPPGMTAANRMIIGANTFHQVAAQLRGTDKDPPGPPEPRGPPEPPGPPGPPPPPRVREAPPPGVNIPYSVAAAPPPPPPADPMPLRSQSSNLALPPPPPPPPGFIPHQIKRPPQPPPGAPPRPPGPPMRLPGPGPPLRPPPRPPMMLPPPPPPMGAPPRQQYPFHYNGPPGPGNGPPGPGSYYNQGYQQGPHPPHHPHHQGPQIGPQHGPHIGPSEQDLSTSAPPKSSAVISAPPVITKSRIVYSAGPVRNIKKKKDLSSKDSTDVSESGANQNTTADDSQTAPPQAEIQSHNVETGPEVNMGIGVAMDDVGVQAMMEISMGPEHVDTGAMPGDTRKMKKEKKKHYVRSAAGQVWEDQTLTEWNPDDFRIFCGDLGNEVTDEVLARAFSKFTTFVKAKVVRDKRTNKTRGYGFVSFRDPNDFVRAMREMNGKYVGNRPIKLRKSTWKDRQIDIVKKKEKEKKRLGYR